MPHAEHHYSITCESDDRAVIYCLRSLAHYAERTAPINAAWGNTGDDIWEEDNHQVTFHFSDPEYRKIFRDVANDILNDSGSEKPKERWKEIQKPGSDDDPALTKEEFQLRRRIERRIGRRTT
jgi:hypothetical protein